MSDFQTKLEILKTVFSGLILVGFVIAFFQFRASLRISRANVLLRLHQEWNSDELYDAVRYIHQLRREWKAVEIDHEKWLPLAESWVAEHVTALVDPGSPTHQKHFKEWMMRRTVSQFISKMGYLMLRGYITPDDFFNVVPELGRLFIVLAPIERGIANHYSRQERPIDKPWDRPFDKLVFEDVMDTYERWFKEHENRLWSEFTKRST